VIRSGFAAFGLAVVLGAPRAVAQEPPGGSLEEARPPSVPQPDRGNRPSGAELELPGDTGLDREPGRSFERAGSHDPERPEREEGRPPAPVDLP
jgi:hypothetical protein